MPDLGATHNGSEPLSYSEQQALAWGWLATASALGSRALTAADLQPIAKTARRRWLWCAAAAGLLSGLVGWGFTVDDALISTRVAHHWIRGLGYQFNVPGETVDAVTPLGWAVAIAPLSWHGPWEGLMWVRYASLLAHVGTFLLLAARALELPHTPNLRATIWLLALAAANLPWSAWATSGMETPWVVLLCALALRPGLAYGMARGVAAGLRPELIPWALVLTVLLPHPTRGALMSRLGVVAAFPLAVAVTRQLVFGRAAPLAVFAKPADFASGLGYALNGFWLLGVPLLWLSLRSWASLPREARAIAVATLAHFGAVAMAGGDWMALFRLLVPMLPGFVWVSLLLLRHDPRWLRLGKFTLATAATALLCLSKGPDARSVVEARANLILAARPALAHSSRIATLDVGWVGAARDRTVIDLAGVTDPQVAHLPGGHTSKRLPRDFLRRRHVDTLVLLLPAGIEDSALSNWRELPFARQVERWVTRLDEADQFVPVARLALGNTGQSYLVLRRLRERLAVLP